MKVWVPIGDGLIEYDLLTAEQKEQVRTHIVRVMQAATDDLYGVGRSIQQVAVAGERELKRSCALASKA